MLFMFANYLPERIFKTNGWERAQYFYRSRSNLHAPARQPSPIIPGFFMQKPTMQKARSRFPGAGSIGAVNCCEADNVPVICPTCQIFLRAALAPRRNLSAA
jgi:hypothetical protein